MSPRRTRVARTSRTRPARRARLLTRRAKLNAARPRRGVLLLVVLSLLVLFLMVGTAFVITAKQSEKSAKSAMKASVRIAGEAAQADLLDEVLLQLIRDTNNPHSSLRFHSLLGDMYGNGGLKTRITGANWASAMLDGTNPTGGQLLELVLDASTARDLSGVEVDAFGNFYVAPTGGNPPPPRFGPFDNTYNGQVLTFLSGPARGRSTRIVGFIPPNRLRVINFQLENGVLVSDPTQLTSNNSPARVLINGRPFTGTGFGLNRTATTPDAAKLSLLEDLGLKPGDGPFGELALLPNAAFLQMNRLRTSQSDDESDPTVIAGHLLSGAQLAAYPVGDAGRIDLAGRIGPAGIGGPNESYDAVDYQNMALALLPGADQLVETVLPDVTVAAPLPTNLDTMVVPSWHRPELVNFWAARLLPRGQQDIRQSNLAGNAMALRRLMMRPSWLDHPNFTGSNPEFAVAAAASSTQEKWGRKLARMVYGPWDVDNDNDGVRDSVWVDVGLPVMAGPNGKLVKPLAAIMVVDMDGRLNVNAHGTCDMAQVGPGVQVGAAAADPTIGKLADGVSYANATPRGMGYGPADISLKSAVGDDDFYRLLTGRYEPGHAKAGQPVTWGGGRHVGPGRYGQDNQSEFRPGRQLQYDLISQIERAGWPQWADGIDSSGAPLGSAFATPPDMRARYGLGLNYFGQPIFEATLSTELDRSNAWKNLVTDSPYELNLSQKTAAGVQGYSTGANAADAPFAIAELERLLRTFDADAGALPGRLGYLSGVLQADNSSRGGLSDMRRLTTDSYDLPSPSVTLPHELEPLVSQNLLYNRLPRSTAELFEIRIRTALQLPPFPEPLSGDPNDASTQLGQVRAVLRRILAPELADGLRLNVNRPLGNGVDDNGNGVVDEPGEVNSRAWSANLPNELTAFSGPTFPDYADDVITNSDGTLSVGQIDHRQYLARHLYSLALTLTAPSDYDPLKRRNGARTDEQVKSDRMLARTLAQWAINVVDFRDHDNVMTAFEYDPDPFDGWGMPNATRQIDGVLTTTDDHLIVGGSPQTASEDRTFVWGAERPELLITETLNWHDRRTDDSAQEQPYPPTDKATSTKEERDPDPDYDQRRRPRGASFIELYNPWAATPGVSADTHRVATRSGVRVDLGVDLAAVDTETGNSPVWRMMFFKRPPTELAKTVMNWNPDDPANLPRAGIGRRSRDVVVDRSVYFAGFDPADPTRNPVWDTHGQAFFNNASARGAVNPIPPVRPERYLVVGSGDDFTGTGVYENFIGDRLDNDNDVQDDQPGGANAKPRRSVNLIASRDPQNPAPSAIKMMNDDGQPFRDPTGNFAVVAPSENNGVTQRLLGDNSQSIADVAIIDQVYDTADGYSPRESGYDASDKVKQQRRRRFTLSEPAKGYPAKFRGSRWTERPGKEGQYLDRDGNPAAIDIPLDGPLRGVDDTQFTVDHPMPYYLEQVDEARMMIDDSGTKPDPRATYAFIFLQRLANPLIPWNPESGKPGHDANRPVNPYMTIDTSTANLTVFNGRETTEIDPGFAGTGYVPVRKAADRFASLQRGYAFNEFAKGPNKVPSLFGWELPSSDRDSQAPGDATAIRLRRPPQNRYDKAINNNSHNFNAVPYHTLGFLNKPFEDSAALGEAKQVKPAKPFSWMTWNNRPYVSGNELLLAPKLSPSLLLREFTTAEIKPTDWSPYKPPTKEEDNLIRTGVFDHLLSFFHEEPEDSNPPIEVAPGVPLHMYRLLEYVHTPSLFTGTQMWANPASFSSNAMPAKNDPTYVNDPRFGHQAPFNSISEFREPGRINLNTLTSKETWEGIFHGAATRNGIRDRNAHLGPDFDDEFAKWRRGYGHGFDDDDRTLLIQGLSPTFFARPYRAPDAGSYVPLQAMVSAGSDGTLLRSGPPAISDPNAPGYNPNAPSVPLYAGMSREVYNNAERHPYFSFAPMIRLDNLVTSRSNVYAVWVTIGFFEVEDVPAWDSGDVVQANFNNDESLFKRVYPEGYAFGREDGVDVGNTRRLRGFYIIDRTQMAGFEPGANHNVENVVRLRRRIE